ncbi:MAG: hypothetical protein GY909_15225 [Oligoflexia bacterium]|nr:hypothetical protein [Oligoflexia bacterium]
MKLKILSFLLVFVAGGMCALYVKVSNSRYYQAHGVCKNHLGENVVLSGEQVLRSAGENESENIFLSENGKVLFKCLKENTKFKKVDTDKKLANQELLTPSTKASHGEIVIASGVCTKDKRVIDVFNDKVLKVIEVKGLNPFESPYFVFQQTDSNVVMCEDKSLALFKISFEQYQKYKDSLSREVTKKQVSKRMEASKRYAYVSSKCSLEYEVDKSGNTKQIKLALLRSPILIEKVDSEMKNIVGLLMNGKFKSRRASCLSSESNTVTLEPVYDEEEFLKKLKPLKERL